MTRLTTMADCAVALFLDVACRSGWHRWIYTERPYWVDGADGGKFRCRCLKRYCLHCLLAQRWNKDAGRWEIRAVSPSIVEFDRREAEHLAENPPERP